MSLGQAMATEDKSRHRSRSPRSEERRAAEAAAKEEEEAKEKSAKQNGGKKKDADDMDDGEDLNDDWADAGVQQMREVARSIYKQEVSNGIGKQIKNLTAEVTLTRKLLKEVTADVYKNSVRVEKPIGKKKMRLKDWWKDIAEPFINEINKNDKVVMTRHSSFVIEVVFRDMLQPSSKVKIVKDTIARKGWEDQFHVTPPYSPECNEQKAPARTLGRSVMACIEKKRPDLDGNIPQQYKLKTIDPCADSPTPEWSISNADRTFAKAKFKGGVMTLTVEETFPIHDVTLEADEVLEDLKWRWTSPYVVNVNYAERTPAGLEPAPKRGEVLEQLRKEKGAGKSSGKSSGKGNSTGKGNTTGKNSTSSTSPSKTFYSQPGSPAAAGQFEDLLNSGGRGSGSVGPR